MFARVGGRKLFSHIDQSRLGGTDNLPESMWSNGHIKDFTPDVPWHVTVSNKSQKNFVVRPLEDGRVLMEPIVPFKDLVQPGPKSLISHEISDYPMEFKCPKSE